MNVRMETHFLGVIIRPHTIYPNSTSLIMLMQVDTDGWLPLFLANRYMAKAPLLWQKLLSNYYWDEYSKYRRRENGRQKRNVNEEAEEMESEDGIEGIKKNNTVYIVI